MVQYSTIIRVAYQVYTIGGIGRHYYNDWVDIHEDDQKNIKVGWEEVVVLA